MKNKTDELLDMLDEIWNEEYVDWEYDAETHRVFDCEDERFKKIYRALMKREPKVFFQLYDNEADDGWGEWYDVNVNSKNYFRFENMVIDGLVAYDDGTYRIRLVPLEEKINELEEPQ